MPSLFDELPPAPPSPQAAYRVLARKYRPQRFEDLIGQEAMVRVLRNAFALGRVPHAFMLTGVRGVGKTTIARIIARALNCIGEGGEGGPTADPCGVCPICRAVLADRHPDVIEMDAASRTGVDDVREIIEATQIMPLEARCKVFIIDEVHMLSRNAFNALLKTLEEPPAHVSFVFATTEIRKVPVTVLSRCMRFDLRRLSVAELSAHFARIAEAEQVAIAPEASAMIARAADGSVRDGLSLLDQAISLAAGERVTAGMVAGMLGLADRGLVFDLMAALAAGRASEVLTITDVAHERGADLGVLLQDLLALVSTLARLKYVPALRTSVDLPEAERSRGAELANALSFPVLARFWQMLLKGIGEVELALNRRAAAEMVLLRLCHVSELPTPGDLMARLEKSGSFASLPATAHPEGGARAFAGGGAVAEGVRLASFRDVIALCAASGEPLLHAHLVNSVRLVRFAPPVIELNPDPSAPRELAARLAALLREASGQRWTVALSQEPGEPSLAEQSRAAEAERLGAASAHPLVRAILEAFPGSRIEAVHDPQLDHLGLLPEVPNFTLPASDPADFLEEES